MTEEPIVAAVSLIERSDGRILCVWNRRYLGWSLPGGKVEPGETNGQAQERELKEETGLETLSRKSLYRGPHNGATVHVFLITTRGQPRVMEKGCPVAWLSREEFLAESPFADFYRELFANRPLFD